MKNLNRWVYAIIGVITLLLAGLVYAWSVMSKSIGASRPDWTAAQLSMTFTMVMAFFCIGCLIAGMMAKKVSPKIAYTQRFKFFILTFPPKNLYYLYSIKKAEKNISPLQRKLL